MTCKRPRALALVALLPLFLLACQPTDAEFVEAAAKGDVQTLSRGLDKAQSPVRAEALRAAVREDKRDTAALILEADKSAAGILMYDLRVAYQKSPDKEPLKVSPQMAGVLLDNGAQGDVFLLPQATRTKDLALAKAVLSHPKLEEIIGRLDPNQRAAWLGTAAGDKGRMVPVEREDAEMIRLLLDHGANPGAFMLTAVRSGKVEMLRVILDKVGGKEQGEVAMEMALHEDTADRPELMRMLLARGIRRPRALTAAAHRGDLDTVRLLLESGSTDLDTAIMNATTYKHPEVLEVLKAHKAKVGEGAEGAKGE